MKFTTNFARSYTQFVPAIGAIFITGTLILVILSLVFIIDSKEMSNELDALQQSNKLLASQKEKLLSRSHNELPSLQALRELAEKVDVYNNITGARGDSITILLSRLELAMPVGTLLKNISHDQQKGELRLTAVSSKVDLLTTFLNNLEQDPHFSTVRLVQQSKSEKNKNEVQFDVRLTVPYS